jgi:hypothetical protein
MCLLIACGDKGPARLYDGNVWGGQLAVVDGTVYFTTLGEGSDNEVGVYAVPASGGSATRLWHGSAHGIPGYGMAVRDGTVYWTGETAMAAGVAAFAVPTSGGDGSVLGMFDTGQAPSQGVAVDDTAMYGASSQEIVRFDRAGATAPSQAVGTPGIGWMVERGGALYYTTSTSVVRLDLGTMQAATVPAAGVATGAFAVDDTDAYVPTATAILRVPLDGSPATPIAVAGQPAQIIEDGDVFYATLGSQVVRIHRDGTTDVLLDGAPTVFALARDGSSLYVANCACGLAGFIHRIDL